MKGRFPDLLNNPATSEAARKLWDETQAMLDLVIKEKWLTANGVFGLFPARQVDEDDVAVYSDETSAHAITRLTHLRQQHEQRAGVPPSCLPDLLAPDYSRRVRRARVRERGGR